MSRQHTKREKRNRRKRYLERVKERANAAKKDAKK